MTLDEEILAEERLDENQELMLYNMSLRQTSQRAAGGREGTHMLLSRIENDPTYQEMIDRGLLECKLYGQGGDSPSAAATLLVTQKGLRYCVLFSSEIEPKRVYDVAGVQRSSGHGEGQDGEFERGDCGGLNYSVITSGVALGGSVAKDAAVALTKEQVERFETIGAQRRGPGVRRQSDNARPSVAGSVSRCFLESDNIWSYRPLGDSLAEIVGVSSFPRVLRIPDKIDGCTVVSIAAYALSANDVVEEITCPDCIGSIGEGAFRMNPNLKRLVLPAGVADFKSSWISRCPNLEELVLPGMVGEITRGMFESKKLSTLVVGSGTSAIEPGVFRDARITTITIDENNGFIATDGAAIYSRDGDELLALVRSVRSLTVAPGCRRLAKKCCYGFDQLEEVNLPDSLVEIGEFAFSHSGVRSIVMPQSLRTIEDKAFFGCTSLQHVVLNDGLETIGDSAFENSAIESLAIPSSILRLGKSMTKGTGVVHSGPGCTLAIGEGCTDLFLDGAGGLYRKYEDGLHLVQLVDGEIESYDVYDGAVAIEPYAFAYHDHIRTVRIPQTVLSIGRSAFRVCRNLASVTLPDSVTSIGEEAFFDSNLESFRVPAALVELGERALVTYGAHHGNTMPSLASIEVAPENEAFYKACGMLCRRTPAGASVVVFTSSEARVVFPDEVTRVEEYAFSNARGIEYLALNPRLSSIGTNGLSTRCWIRQIHVELSKPLKGREVFDFFFPDTSGAVRGIALGLGGASWVNVPGIMEQLDLCLVNARDYNVPGKSDNISAYAQAKLILDRLDDPVMLTPRNRSMMERVLRNNIEDICVDVALYDDRGVLDDLIERGFVNADNLDAVIERVGALRDAATSAHLLEAKRQRFSRDTFDYDL